MKKTTEVGKIHEEHKEELTTINILNKVEGCIERVKRFVSKLPSANDLTKILNYLEVILYYILLHFDCPFSPLILLNYF